MEIREAMKGDREQVLEFCRDTFSWGDYIEDVWERWEFAGGLYVMEDGGAVVGMYHLARLEKESWIEGMRVRPEYRKRGLGKRMMLHAESVIKSGTIRLIIESKNRASISLATSAGYGLEDEWRLFTMAPDVQTSYALPARETGHLGGLISSNTYADSWKWLPLDESELSRLAEQGRVIGLVENGKAHGVGIWYRSDDFPQTFQIGFVGGTDRGVLEILKCAKNMAHDMHCDRIQVFVREKTGLRSEMVERKSLFYLMRKDL